MEQPFTEDVVLKECEKLFGKGNISEAIKDLFKGDTMDYVLKGSILVTMDGPICVAAKSCDLLDGNIKARMVKIGILKSEVDDLMKEEKWIEAKAKYNELNEETNKTFESVSSSMDYKLMIIQKLTKRVCIADAVANKYGKLILELIEDLKNNPEFSPEFKETLLNRLKNPTTR